MGICSSYESTQVATAKLILQDGRMMEFTSPVKVGYVLQKNPMCFICNADDMDFDNVVSAISADEEFQLGQLYFALPLSALHQSLKAEEMAALAVKASSALMRSGGSCGRDKCKCRRKCVPPVIFSARRVAAVGSNGETTRNGKRRGGGGSGRRKYAARLSKIEE
ncbi:hypothetical protein CARUB_v10024204mg [Capsella rubella]|uniref:HTH-type transcriptional regulator n=1 Tax=Capsella rubella TaxID=81985 RepID=R0HVE2_9BRAS|nr:uncharacterized protein LOC17888446 [Capsella rubella]EOA28028.1 hypothetical protein CARUB_v10024204mg [Capsella rubella]